MIADELLLVGAVTTAGATLINVVGSSLYDVRQLAARRRQQAHPYRRRYRQRPLVSVVVTAENSAATVESCLGSLLSSDYRKLEIIVADNASIDQTRHVVRRLIKLHPRQIRLYARRRRASLPAVLDYAVKKHVAGELVLLINADEIIDQQAISETVRQFNVCSKAEAVRLNAKIQPAYKLSGLCEDYAMMLRSRINKANQAWGVRSPVFLTSGWMLKKDVLQSMLLAGARSLPYRTVYLSAAAIYRPSSSLIKQADRLCSWLVQTMLINGRNFFRQRRMLSISDISALLVLLLQLGAHLCLPALLTYFSYMAIHLREASFLLISWCALALFALSAIWEDELLKPVQKFKYILLLPSIYGWFYALSLLQYVTLTAGLWRLRWRRNAISTDI